LQCLVIGQCFTRTIIGVDRAERVGIRGHRASGVQIAVESATLIDPRDAALPERR
jgi:hypothetical protein